MYPILDTRVLIQNGVKLFYFACICWRSLRALLIQNGVKPVLIKLDVSMCLRALVLWSDRDTCTAFKFKKAVALHL